MGWSRAAGIAGMVVMVAAARTMAAQPGEANGPQRIEQLQKRASRGDVAAALEIGLVYDTGNGVPEDDEQAARWYRQAADGGSAVAAFDLATLYNAGRLGPRDATEALRWYRVAAARGFGRAAYVVGTMIEAGDGTAVDRAEAARWYRKAAAEGVAAARGRLKVLEAEHAPAVGPSPANARQAFTQAVERWRQHGLDGHDPDATAALRSAAGSGFPLAEYDLAYSYEHGVGIDRDVSLAYAWYKLAAESDGTPGLKAAAAVNRDRLGHQLSDEERTAAEETSTGLAPGHL